MATFSRHQASLGNVGSYQVSGYPYISGSTISTAQTAVGQEANAEVRFRFPKVAKSVTVIYVRGNAGTPDAGSGSAGLRVHFNSTGSAPVAVGQTGQTNTADDGITPDLSHGTTNFDTADGSTNTSGVIRYGHYIELNAPDESITFNTKCTEIYISRPDCETNDQGNSDAETIEFRVIAELTNIPAGELSQLTGSGLTSVHDATTGY